MKKFIYSYFLLLIVLFLLLYWDISPIAKFINNYQTEWTLYLLDMGLEDGRLKGIDIFINPHYKVIVTKACNGLIPILVFWSAVIAYPVTWGYRVKWLFLGYITISIVNVIRLLIVASFVERQQDFPFYHDLIGNILLMVTGLVLFYFFLKHHKFY